MEKVKDFLYDISDFIFSLLIIVIIFLVVSFKLTDTMQVHFFSNLGKDSSTDLSDATTPSLDDIDGNPVTTPDDTTEVVLPVEEEPEEEETPPVEEETIVEVKDVAFEIAPGSPGFKIATNLEAAGLIENVDVFISKLDELNLGNKLRAGTFTLNTGMSVEEIIRTLAGQ